VRLTIEETNTGPFIKGNRKIIIEAPGDDRSMSEMIDDLIRPALLAMGFHPDTVNKYLPE
jgi:hypothetical protein